MRVTDILSNYATDTSLKSILAVITDMDSSVAINVAFSDCQIETLIWQMLIKADVHIQTAFEAFCGFFECFGVVKEEVEVVGFLVVEVGYCPPTTKNSSEFK